jgi:seryl-tRNA synthetase
MSSDGSFLAELVSAGLLIPGGVDGVFGRGPVFEAVVEAFDRFVTDRGSDLDATALRFPPLLGRRAYERTEHVRSFPQLIGSVHSFAGGDAEHAELLAAVEAGADWSGNFTASDLVFTPAACYPLYPRASGTLGPDGLTYDVMSYCFRNEPSLDPARMQLFRMHEFVRIASPEAARMFRDAWVERALAMLRELGLPAVAVPACDPFFGRVGGMLAASQLEQALKQEIVIPITSEERPTACASSNYHQDHFGRAFEIRLPDGRDAHSACVAFGLERVALALLRVHGTRPAAWPGSVRTVLAL